MGIGVPSILVKKEEISTCACLPYCLGPWPSSVPCPSTSCRSISLCCRSSRTRGMEALQKIPPFLKLHVFPTVMSCHPIFALLWPSGLRKPPAVLLISCQVDPEPFLPLYRDRRPFTARGTSCPGPCPAGTLLVLTLSPQSPALNQD